jgi:DNA-binding NtrC family response regulator
MAGKTSETVVIVDDDRSFVDAVAILFEQSGYRARKAYGGCEGLELVRRNRADVAIIDVNMPDLNGVELANQIANLPRPIPVILISSDDSRDNATRCQAMGTGMFLAKPLDPEVLLETVSRILATRT